MLGHWDWALTFCFPVYVVRLSYILDLSNHYHAFFEPLSCLKQSKYTNADQASGIF